MEYVAELTEWFDESNFKLNMNNTKEMCLGGNKNTKPHPLSELQQIKNQFKLPLHCEKTRPSLSLGHWGGAVRGAKT